MEDDNRQPEKPKDATDAEQARPSPLDPIEQVSGDNNEAVITPNGPERARDSAPQIWIGSLSDYNNGTLHGEWMDAARDAEEIHADIRAILARSPTAAKYGDAAEEWGIFDHEGFGAYNVPEYESIEIVSRIARGIAEHGPAFAAWADVMDGEEALDGFADAYLGEYDSLEAYATQLVEDLGYNQILDDNLPEHVRRYVEINVAGLAQDMWLSGDVNVYHRDGGGVWLFDGRR